jgi:hypothetical protein
MESAIFLLASNLNLLPSKLESTFATVNIRIQTQFVWQVVPEPAALHNK